MRVRSSWTLAAALGSSQQSRAGDQERVDRRGQERRRRQRRRNRGGGRRATDDPDDTGVRGAAQHDEIHTPTPDEVLAAQLLHLGTGVVRTGAQPGAVSQR